MLASKFLRLSLVVFFIIGIDIDHEKLVLSSVFLWQIYDSIVFYFQGFIEVVPWPWWCQLLAAVLIMSSVLWIPGVAIVKYFRLLPYKEEVPTYFPEDELIEERNIKPHENTFIEKNIFGYKD